MQYLRVWQDWQRQRHHLVKQLQQAAKKAKTFLVRRLLRKAGEAGAAAGNSDEKLRALRAVSPAAVARRALGPLGLADLVIEEKGAASNDGESSEPAPPLQLEEWERRLVS